MFERQDNNQTIIRRELDEKEYFTRTREKKKRKKSGNINMCINMSYMCFQIDP